MVKLVEKLWSEVNVGNQFPDGSMVTEITTWEYKKCYKLTLDNNDSIVASYEHLFYVDIEENENVNINKLLKFSEIVRKEIGTEDTNWVTVKDLWFISGLSDLTIYMVDNEGNKRQLIEIDPYENGKPQKVRCISTTTGQYIIGGFLNHNTGGKDLEKQKEKDILYNTYDAYKTSPIIQKALQGETTEERRRILFEGLKEEYKKNGLSVEDYNLEIIAKKMTSYKRSPTRLVEKGEVCDIVSLSAIGNYNNPMKQGELASSYKVFTKPQEFDVRPDSANNVIFD